MLGGGEETEVLAAFDAAIKCSHLTDPDKLSFSARKLEYLEETAGDISM